MRLFLEAVGLMLDPTTIALALCAIPLYILGLFLADFWSALKFVTWGVSNTTLERTVRWLMLRQLKFRLYRGNAHRLLWRAAMTLDAVWRARQLSSTDEVIRWRAVVRVGTLPVRGSALHEVEKLANVHAVTPSARTAAAMLEERGVMTAAAGQRR